MASETEQNIASRVVEGSLISGLSSVFTIGLGFIRTILLTIYLLPDDVGVVTQALFFVSLSTQLRMPGLHRAFIQRKDAHPNLFKTYFSLYFISILVSVGIIALFTPVITQFYPDMPLLSAVLFAFLGVEIVKGFNEIRETAYKRDLSFSTIGIANIASAIGATIVAPIMASMGFGAWALVGERVAAQLARTIALMFGKKTWRYELGIDWQITKAFWDYGVKIWTAKSFTFVINKFDDFWIGLSLGQASLGLYSRAYDFAHYSRNVVGSPIVMVFFSTFSRLQEDRLKLSKAFFRAFSLLIRVGFLFALLFVFPAPEFIKLLGDQWLPMVSTFQLMVIYMMIEPLWMIVERLLAAVGHPELAARIKGGQLLVFVPMVILFSQWQGIFGVAIAVNIVTLLGFIILFSFTRRFVDYSLRALFFWPLVAFGVTAVSLQLISPTLQPFNLWTILLLKLFLILLIYGAIIWLTERDQLLSGWQLVWDLAQPSLARFRQNKNGKTQNSLDNDAKGDE
jgi:O-antigen/teichoic acid export membrane protein